MTVINLELEDNLSAVQVSKIKELLGLIKGVVRVTGGESHQLARLSPSAPAEMSVLPGEQVQQINLDSINPRQKKYIISQAIAWGSKRGKINLSRLERLNPEEIMNMATSFLSEMTDSEKDEIFREIS